LSTWNDPEINKQIPFFADLPEIHRHARSFPVDRRFPSLAHAIERGVTRAIETDDSTQAIMSQMQLDAIAAWTGEAS
jgi:multiple sugar transport system substrate-binding protein